MCLKNKAKKQANVAIAAQAAEVDKLLADASTQRAADTKAQQDMLATLTTNTDKTITALQSQNKTLVDQLNAQAGGFLSSQQDLIAAQNKATQQAADTAASLLLQRQQQAQSVKKPNYAEILKRQKALNGGGLSSTMLTGPSGVAPGAMTLGQPTLLGG